MFGSISLLSLAFLLFIYPLYLLIFYGLINVPKKRINRAAQIVAEIRFEGFMQKLQQEVRFFKYYRLKI